MSNIQIIFNVFASFFNNYIERWWEWKESSVVLKWRFFLTKIIFIDNERKGKINRIKSAIFNKHGMNSSLGVC
jgi:hypothetical protein